jgi:hypothetical protein
MTLTRLVHALGLAALLLAPGAASAQTLPPTIPIFPLGDVVLFPAVSRPFYIFEPRYRAMIADALKGDRIIGMILLRPGYEKDYEGRPPIYEVGTAGEIVDFEELPDGQYAIVLRGLTKFRVLGEDQSRVYRLARVEAVPEQVSPGNLAELSTLREQVAMLFVSRLPPDASGPDPSLSDESYVNTIAQYINVPEAARQGFLEQGNALLRARALVDLLTGR